MGILYDLEITQIATYSWSLEATASNVATTYTLLRGLIIVKEFEVTSLIVVGDFMIIIKAIQRKSSPMDIRLAKVIAQAIKEVKTISATLFYHVKHEFNKEANK